MACVQYTWDEPRQRRTHNETLPEDVDEVQKFVKKNGLRHGDVLSFSDRESFIICQKLDGKVSILSNPDDSQSGHLTIPADVLMSCKSSYEQYKSIISESAAINLHMSPSDTFLTERFGAIPDSWKFDVHFSYGEVENIYVSTDDVDWHAVNAEGEPMADIKARLNYKNEVQFTLPIELEGDILEQFKRDKGMTNYAWLKALPDIPPTWRIEKGESAGGKDWQRWEWILSGTKRDQQEAEDAVKCFFNVNTEGVEVDQMCGLNLNVLSINA